MGLSFGVIFGFAIFSLVLLFLILPVTYHRRAEVFASLKDWRAAPRVEQCALNSCFRASWPPDVAANAENKIQVERFIRNQGLIIGLLSHAVHAFIFYATAYCLQIFLLHA